MIHLSLKQVPITESTRYMRNKSKHYNSHLYFPHMQSSAKYIFAIMMSAPAPCYESLVGYYTGEEMSTPVFHLGNTSAVCPHTEGYSGMQYTCIH